MSAWEALGRIFLVLSLGAFCLGAVLGMVGRSRRRIQESEKPAPVPAAVPTAPPPVAAPASTHSKQVRALPPPPPRPGAPLSQAPRVLSIGLPAQSWYWTTKGDSGDLIYPAHTIVLEIKK